MQNDNGTSQNTNEYLLTDMLNDSLANTSRLLVTTVTASRQADIQPGFTTWQAALIGLFLSTIILISVVGNVLVCVAILTDRKLKKVSNLFLISLAISDLVVSSLVMPFAVANDILAYWPFYNHFCNIWISLDILSATASILNLCAISLDRYIHMTNPFAYEQWMTNRKCLGFIALIWLASLLISFLPINLGWHQELLSKTVSNTTTTTTIYKDITTMSHNLSMTTSSSIGELKQCVMELNPIYAVTSSSISFFLPCVVMVAIYIKMYNLARYHAQSIKRTQAYCPANGGKHKIGENKALFTLGMIMGLFLVSWIPFFTINLVLAFCEDCVSPKLFVAVTWLGYFNSTMNPFIYSKFNSDFRAAFKRILCCEKCKNRDPYEFKTRSRTSSNMAMKKLNTNGSLEGVQNGNAQSHINGYSNAQPKSKDLTESQSLIEKEDINDNVFKEVI